jgi:hypothetical protein
MINKYTSMALASPNRTIPGFNDSNGNPIVFNGSQSDVRYIMSRLFTYTKERTDKDGNIIRTQEPLHIFTMLLPKN